MNKFFRPAVLIAICGFPFLSAAQTTIDANAQQQATARHPDLLRAGSPLNKKFLQLFNQAEQNDPAVLLDPRWPIILSDSAAALLAQNASPSPSPTPLPAAAPAVASGTGAAAVTLTLTAPEKAQIRAEEIYRSEVEKEIAAQAPPASQNHRLWALLNSSFTLWFLSSIVIAGLTAAVTASQKRHSERIRRIDVRRRLNIEISSRISESIAALLLDEKRINEGSVYYLSSIYGVALRYLDNSVTSDKSRLDFSIYPEYRQRKFRSLIFELTAVGEPGNLPALRDAQNAYAELEKLTDQSSVGENYTRPPAVEKTLMLEAIHKVLDLMKRLELYPFWRTP